MARKRHGTLHVFARSFPSRDDACLHSEPEFVHAGGYADAKYWSGIEFERDGETILRE